jgi:hypothetical protein
MRKKANWRPVEIYRRRDSRYPINRDLHKIFVGAIVGTVPDIGETPYLFAVFSKRYKKFRKTWFYPVEWTPPHISPAMAGVAMATVWTPKDVGSRRGFLFPKDMAISESARKRTIRPRISGGRERSTVL